jgi:Spy/CpxP family protein refolding chaperone
MKTLTKTLVLILAGFLCTQNIFAQQANIPDQSKRKAQHEQKFKVAAEKLNLTADQQTKLKALLEQNRAEMKALREANKEKPKEEKRKAMLEQMKKMDTQVSAILDSKQQELYKQMKAEKRAEMKKKREERMKMHEEMEGEEGIF